VSDGFGVEPGSFPPVAAVFEGRGVELQAAAAVPVREAARLAPAAGDARLAEAAAVFGAGMAAAVDGLGQECRLLGHSLVAAAKAYEAVDRSVLATGPRLPTAE
jgi:hypothetical protein